MPPIMDRRAGHISAVPLAVQQDKCPFWAFLAPNCPKWTLICSTARETGVYGCECCPFSSSPPFSRLMRPMSWHRFSASNPGRCGTWLFSWCSRPLASRLSRSSAEGLWRDRAQTGLRSMRAVAHNPGAVNVIEQPACIGTPTVRATFDR